MSDDIDMTSPKSQKNAKVDPMTSNTPILACVKYNEKDANTEKDEIKTILSIENIFNSDIETTTLYRNHYVKITLIDVDIQTLQKLGPLLKTRGYRNWEEIQDKFRENTVHVTGIPRNMTPQDFFNSFSHIRKEVEDVEIRTLTGSNPKSRLTAKIVCKTNEDAQAFLKTHYLPIKGKLIFLSSKPEEITTTTWVLSGLPKETTELVVLLSLSKTTREKTSSVLVDESTRKAYIIFKDNRFVPEQINNLRWSHPGQSHCHKCMQKLPEHSITCPKHIENSIYTPPKYNKSQKVMKEKKHQKP